MIDKHLDKHLDNSKDVAVQIVERIGSSGRTRTYNHPVNSRVLYH